MANEFKIKNGLVVSGSADIEQDLRVRGTLTVDELHASITTSSIIYESGSTKFGDDIADSHDFTGSVNISGSINLNGQAIGTGKLDETTFNTFTSSYITNSGSFDTRVDNLESFSASLDNSFVSETEFGSYTSSANTRLGNIETSTGSLNTFSSSANGRLTALESTTSSINTFTASINTTINNIINNGTLVSGSSQVNITGTTGYSTFSSSIDTSINTLSSSIATTDLNQNNRLNSLETASGSIRSDFNSYTSSNNSTNSTQNGRLDAIETSTGSLNTFTNSINTTIKNKLNSDGVISGSIQVDLTSTTNYSVFSASLATTDTTQDGRLNSIEGKTGSYATTGSNRFNGNQTITGSLIVTENLQVYGSSSITYVTASQLAVSNSFISVNVFEPAERFGGLKVFDSGSSAATASIVWDSLNNRWIYQNVDGASYHGAMFIAGPRNSGSLGDEVALTSGKIPKSVGGDHIDNSIMNETSGVIYVTGSLSATGTVGGTNITAIESTTSSLNTYTASNDSTNTTQNSRLTSIETSTGSLNSFTNSINTTIKTKLNTEGVISGSAQVAFGSISGVPSGLVSGSSQISFGSVSGVPSGLVSGSSQITFGSISGIPSGLVSGSSQVLSGTGIWSGSAQLPSGVVSGSSQITFGSISGVPSDLVSGSSQITLSSTTGFGSYLNQAVLTSSSPSFSSIYSAAAGGFYLGDTGAGIYRDNTYDVVITQNNSSSGVLYLSNAGSIIVSLDNNNNETDRKFIIGSNAVKATNELFSVNESGTVYVGGYLTVNGSGTSSSIYMKDSDEGDREIHCNSNRIGFLNQSSSWGAYCDDSGNWFSDFSMRAPIFYDSQDTGYYVDPNGTSNIYTLTVNNQVNHNTSSSRAKYHVYGSDGLYCIGMQSSVTYGGLNDWSMTFQFNNETDRGFWWGHNGHSTAQGAMALTTNGNLTVARRIRVGYGESDVSDPTVPLQVYGSGGTVVDIQGSAGQLFSVTDDLTGDIFAISDISGVPMINVNTTNGTSFGSTIFPSANNAYDLGTSSYRWANVYTNDLHLSNEGKTGGNDIDGTTGNWTIQEGAEQLYIINNKNGKKYKINLTEVE